MELSNGGTGDPLVRLPFSQNLGSGGRVFDQFGSLLFYILTPQAKFGPILIVSCAGTSGIYVDSIKVMILHVLLIVYLGWARQK